MASDEVRTLVSQIPRESDKARWEIRGFSWLELDDEEECAYSQWLMTLCDADFRLWMSDAGGNASGPARFIKVGIEVKTRDYSVSFKERVCIIHRSREIREKKDGRVRKVRKHSQKAWQWDEYATYAELCAFAEEDVLVFQLEVDACQTVGLEQVPPLASAASDHGQPSMSRDFGELLRKGVGTDVELCLKGAGALRAHRVVLAARSPVFESMLLSSGMAESVCKSKVQALDTELDVARLFLEYMYTDKVSPEIQKDDEMMCHLLAVAHKYQVPCLVDVCTAAIAAKLSDENTCERLMMADMLDVARLKEIVLRFATRSKEQFARVQSTGAYARMVQQRPHLLADILSQFVTKKRPPEPGALPADLEALTLVNLKRLLSDRGLSTSGNKQALVGRLRSSLPSGVAAGSTLGERTA